MPFEHPQRINIYRILKLLGSGSYGHTYEVEDDQQQQYALKWLRPDAEIQGALRFQNEAWALENLDHPAVPSLIARGEHDERPYIVMTLARGESLRSLWNRQTREVGTISQMKLVSIMESVLNAVEYMQSKEIYHRDIKDANIISNESAANVTLVDFGVCKGTGQPVDADTFWNAGASRFSAPSKLRHPGQVHPTHDVFSVGVVAYQLLTNRFPWSVGDQQDRGDLEAEMRRSTPVAAHRVNNLVDRRLSEFINKLLFIDDERRPTAAAALAELAGIREAAEVRVAAPAVTQRAAVRYLRVVRDPVHGDIVMTDFEWKVLNSPEYQRLRWIRQLGTGHFVFPGAEHSRLSHSLGTMYIATEILRRIAERLGDPFEPEELLMARTYSLVHDVTHIPFGHTLEDELGFFQPHDDNQGRKSRLLLSDKSELGNVLRSTDYGRLVLGHLDGEATISRHSWLQELVSSPSGADVLDYIDRDALFCGLDHRVDSAIFRHFTITSDPLRGPDERHLIARLYGRHGFRMDAEFALESVLRERLGLFMKVYTHPVKIAAGAMLGKALSELATEGGLAQLELQLEAMGDADVLSFLRGSDRSLARELAGRLQSRHLHKPVFRSRALRTRERTMESYDARRSQLREKGLFSPSDRAKAEIELAKASGLKGENIVIYCPAKAPGIQKARQYIERRPGRPELRDEVHDSHLRIFENHLALWTIYVFAPSDTEQNRRNRLAEAAETLFGLPNEIQFERRQLLLPI